METITKRTIHVKLTERAKVRDLLNRVESTGAVSVYLYGREYGYFLQGRRFWGLIED